MANKPANAKQKQWMNTITEFAESNLHILYGIDYEYSKFQRHHVLGRSAKHNKVAIGHWFILPVPFELHDVSSNHPLNVTHRKMSFTNAFGKQSQIFNDMLRHMDDQGYEYDIPVEVIDAIASTGV